MEAFRRVDNEVKSHLRGIKHQSLRAFCESSDPATGLSRTWRTVKVLASRAEKPHIDVVTDPDSPVIRGLQDELVRSDTPPPPHKR